MHSLNTKNNWNFHFNGDYSGDIIVCPPNSEQQFLIDGDALIEFSKFAVSDLIIEHLEKTFM